MEQKNKEKLKELTQNTGTLIDKAYKLSEIYNAETMNRTIELVNNKNPDKTAKLFLEYRIADEASIHVNNAYKHILDATRELEKAEKVRENIKRGIAC